MIEHLRKYKNKILLYVVPVKPYPYNKITNYIVCKVRLLSIGNTTSVCKIISIIQENNNFKYYRYCMLKNLHINCSNEYLFELNGVNYES